MSQSNELTVPERAAVALGAAEHEKTLIQLSKKFADIIEIKNSAGREQAHSAYMTLKNARIAIEKAGKDARDDATKFSKAVIAEVDRLTAITTAEELRLQVLRDAYDDEREAERQAKVAAEAERVRKIKARIEGFMLDAVTASDGTAAEIDAHATALSETVISLDEYMEFAGEAQVKRNDTVKWLRERQQQAADREAEAKRIAEERAQFERDRAAAEERDRVAAIVRAEQEAKDRAERERVEAEQRAAQEQAAAAMRAEQEAHAKRMAEERAKLEREQAALAAERRRHMEEAEAARLERERIAREAQERAEAEARAKREAEEAAARAEAARIRAEQDAAIAEQQRREREQFAMNGPGDVEIVLSLAEKYAVAVGDVMQWMKKFNYEAVDAEFAAMNANGSLPHMQQAA